MVPRASGHLSHLVLFQVQRLPARALPSRDTAGVKALWDNLPWQRLGYNENVAPYDQRRKQMDRPYEDPEETVNEVRTLGSERLPMVFVHLIRFYARIPALLRRKQARLSSPARAHT